ncbi:TonB-dependent receptor [Paraflavisolibacter sp. H34]|uniref:TonB-dependent receptor n=1 Tax=Huijunlia imazamoxiresistens TaxID=3127457 RepID=UPI0030190073
MKLFTSSLLCVALAAGTANAQVGAIAVSNAPAPVVLIDEAENGTIQGRITTTDNKPAAFVNISLKEINKNTLTDEKGYFLIRNIKPGNYTLTITMAGLQPQEKAVEVRAKEVTGVELSLAEDHKQLDEIVVTSQKSFNAHPTAIGKVAIDPMDLPQSVAVIGQGVLRDQQVQRLSDVIKNVNGMYLTTTRGNAQESFGSRGYGLSSTNLFKNGARVNVGIMPEMSSLEKVEVLKGSAAILYGQVAPGGIINMVTKQPKFNFGGEVSFRGGSYDLYKPSFDVYGPATKNIAYRLNGTYETAGSYRNGVSSKRYYVNPSLLFKLGERTDLVLEADYLKHDYTPDFGIGSVGNTLVTPVSRSTFFNAPWAYNKVTQTAGTATVKHQFNSDWTLSAIAAYQDYNRDYMSTERIQAAANGDWERPLGRMDQKETYYMGQVNLTGKFQTGAVAHTLLSGMDADRSVVNNTDFTFAAANGFKSGTYDKINLLDGGKFIARTDIPTSSAIRKRETPVNRAGAYIQDLVKLSSKFNLLAGIRWSYVKNAAVDSTNLLTNAKTKGKDDSEKAFSPRFGLVYKPFNTTSVFASYSNSFNVVSGTDVYGKQLDPAQIDQYEIGVKNDFFQGRFSANVTAYRIVNDNLTQTALFKADGVTQNSDASIKMVSGTSTSDGVEVDLAGQPVTGLNVMAGYAYNYMRITKSSGLKNSPVEGERLVNNPAHTANASVFYTFQNNKLKGVKIGAIANYIGERVGGWNNTINQTQGYDRRIFVDGYTTIDLSAGYTFKKVSLLAKVSNLTNVYNYTVHENYSINPIAPTQFSGTISYRF